MSQPAVEFRPVAPGDASALAGAMRAQDAAECHAAGHLDLHRTVLDSVAMSARSWTCITDGRLAAVFGIAPGGTLLAPFGVPWLLGTDEVPRHRRVLARTAGPYIQAMLSEYRLLRNWVHADNTIAVAWLKRVGFKLQPPIEHPATGALFHPFEMRL